MRFDQDYSKLLKASQILVSPNKKQSNPKVSLNESYRSLIGPSPDQSGSLLDSQEKKSKKEVDSEYKDAEIELALINELSPRPASQQC